MRQIVSLPFMVKIINAVIKWLLMLMGVTEAIHGIGQLFGLVESNHSLYVLTGSFYNPGPYMGFLAMVFPICLYEYIRTETARRYAFLALCLIVFFLLPVGMSRSAWVAVIVGSVYVLYVQYKKTLWVCMHRHSGKMIVMSVMAVSLLSVTIIGAYSLKKDSVHGRLLIWKTALVAICDKPWTGYGWDRVAGVYGEAQENYFAKGDYTKKDERVAGSPKYMFNEYIQVAMAWGLPSLFFLLGAIAYLMYMGHLHGTYGLCGALISFGTFSFSSYPLQFPIFILSLMLLVIGCGTNGLLERKGRYVVLSMLLLLSIILVNFGTCYNLLRRHVSEKEWERYRVSYYSGDYEQVVNCYSKHLDEMKHSDRFLFEYGHALHRLHRNEESNQILEQAMWVSSDPMILNIIAKNCQEMKQYYEAERFLLKSVHRLPMRVYPYYLLAKLYVEADCFPLEKVKWAKRNVMEKESKVHSKAVEQMRQQVIELTEKYFQSVRQ